VEMKFVVSSRFEGYRLDCAVALKNSDWSRSAIAQLIKRGEILVSGKEKKPSYRVHAGDLISCLLPDLHGDRLLMSEYPIEENSLSDHFMNKYAINQELLSSEIAPDLPFDILHEDHQILVINKKPGVVVHPAPGNLSGTLVHFLISYYPQIRSVGEDIVRPGIVHRLDRDTSGVMVVAKEKGAFCFLKREFMQRRVEKRYIALVSGNLRDDSGHIVMPIGRHPVKRKMMSTIAENGRYAETLWKVIQRHPGATLVEAELKTGRTHQVRVHFKALGHPLVGDSVYGFRSGCRLQGSKKRQMLHAWKLSFRHPWSGRRVEFKAPLPHDMAEFIDSV